MTLSTERSFQRCCRHPGGVGPSSPPCKVSKLGYFRDGKFHRAHPSCARLREFSRLRQLGSSRLRVWPPDPIRHPSSGAQTILSLSQAPLNLSFLRVQDRVRKAIPVEVSPQIAIGKDSWIYPKSFDYDIKVRSDARRATIMREFDTTKRTIICEYK